MVKISIIVPVYNTEKYVKKCLDALTKQKTKQEIEILIINDGSNDKSELNIKEYMNKNPEANIKYYTQKNAGISESRNRGLKKATGDYVLFVDSDDYINEDTIKKLEPYIEQNIDMIKFKMQKVSEDGKILDRIDGPVFDKLTGEEAFNTLYTTDVLLDSACLYLIKKDLFIKNKFEFKRRYHEDFGLIPLLMLVAKSVVSIPEYCYQYVQRTNSITRNEDYNKTLYRLRDVLAHYDNMIEVIEKLKISKYTKENVKIYYTNAVILKTLELKKSDQKYFIKEIKKRKMEKNIKVRNFKQFIKRILLKINIKLYLKMR